MRHSLIFAGLACTLSSTAMADTLGFEVGAYAWNQNLSGDLASGKFSSVNVESDETNNVFYALLEHPIPLIPNVRIQQTDLDLSATGSGFEYNGVPISSDVNSDIDLSHTDFTLYYEILDNWISLDLGITARAINDGSITITSAEFPFPPANFESDGVLPLLYVSARFDLPLTGLYVGADINGLGINDNSLIDYRVNLGYESTIGLGIEAGFRSFELDYDDDDDKANLTIDGAYAGVFYHF